MSGSYFPSAKVRLRVRFEDFGRNVLKDKAPKKSTQRLKGIKDERAPLRVVLDPDAPEELTRYLLVPAVQPGTSGTPQAQTGSSDGLSHEVSGVIPKQAKWSQNSFRQADTLSLAIRWADFPIDPRCIRSCAVLFYLGTVSEQEYAMGIGGLSRGDLGRSGSAGAELLNVIPDTYLDALGRSRTNLRFEGWADKWKMSWSDDEPIVELECTDNTRLFLKQSQPSRLCVGREKSIDEAVAEYLTHFPQLQGLTVEYRPPGAVPPKLKAILSGTSFVPDLGPPTAGGGGGEPANIWDYLTKVCGAVAHMIRVDGTSVVIQSRADAMGTGPVPRSDDPYRGRNLESGRYEARAFVFGRNIQSLTMEREFSAKETKNIELRAFDSQRKTLLVARYPDEAVVGSTPGDGRADKDWSVHYAPAGVRDLPTLKRIAEEEYNNAGRQSIVPVVKTRNMASLGGDNLDPDILDMQPGDAFEILVDRRPVESSVVNATEASMSEAELARKHLVGLGYPDAFAAAYAKAYADAGFQRLYKLKEMSVDWSVDEGVSLELTGMNYVVARVDQPSDATKASVAKQNLPARQQPPGGLPPKGTAGDAFEVVDNPDGTFGLRPA